MFHNTVVLAAYLLISKTLHQVSSYPMGSQRSGRTLSEGNYFDHIEDNPDLFHNNEAPAAWAFDNSYAHQQNYQSSQDSIVWNGVEHYIQHLQQDNMHLEQGQAQQNVWQEGQHLYRQYPQVEEPLFIPNHVGATLPQQEEVNHYSGKHMTHEHEWIEHIDEHGNHQLFDDEGNLLQKDEQGIYRIVDNDGNLHPIEYFNANGVPAHMPPFAVQQIVADQYSPMLTTEASPGMSGTHYAPQVASTFASTSRRQHHQRNNHMQEEVAENNVQSEYHKVAEYYGRPGMNMLNKFYRDFCGDDSLTEEQASEDLSHGLDFHLAEKLYTQNKDFQREAAERIYYQARFQRANRYF